MKKYIIAKMKSGEMKSLTAEQLRSEIDNIASWLSIKANSVENAINKFPALEAKYKGDADNLKHIIDLDAYPSHTPQ